ncbi:MAG: endolytic transglycosylase MltG [Oscillospiraceae bacterium]|nr:endolytic transglycosylase MltG [Oscillospiraceae bacterium]
MRENRNDYEYERPRRRRRRGRGFFTFVSILLVLGIAVFLALFAISSAIDMFAFGKDDKQIELTVEKGMGVGDIADLLGEKGVIEQPFMFKNYAKLRQKDNGFQAGDYVLNSNMSYDRIITAMRMGNTVKEEVTITFYEGMTISEIADLLEEKKVCDADEFIEMTQSGEFTYEFIDMMPESNLRFRKLEGYIFPDTYDFYVGENVTSVVRKFLKTFQSRVMGMYSEIQDSGMTLDEAIILASIIQKEASNEEEMAKVSSVFHNRINNAKAGLPMLQSDVTINYVENDIKPYQTRSVQEMYDAYNTYVCHGLPVGPICNPGLDAIKAAIAPEDTDYYFFVTDVNGKYYYGKTLNEHYSNVRKAAAAGGTKHGTDVK